MTNLDIIYDPGIVKACPTSLEGWTFKFIPGQDVFITGLSSADVCQEECSKSETCQGFTFHISPPLNFCYLFSDTSTLTYCEGDCYTATLTTVLSDSSCSNNNEDLITSMETNSVDDCLSLCEDEDSCTHFIWFNENSLFAHTCFLYRGECEGVTGCTDCESGVLQCIYPTPPQCNSYLVLDDDTRNVNGTIERKFCDMTPASNGGTVSPDWQGGDRWYRMLPPAGTVIPESIPKPRTCGTSAAGWLMERHPEHAGVTKEATVCFTWNENPDDNHICRWYTQISVTNCGGYYVYLLPTAPRCTLRYCTVDNL